METRPVPEFRMHPVVVLLLSFLTCGLFLIYWNYKAAEVLNAVAGRELLAPVLAAVSGCCLPLNLFFYYQCGKGLEALGERTSRPELKNLSVLLLVLGFFVPMVAAMIVQQHINELYEA
ncbi:MAG TPA: DUF4234 domain-containing protein [Acidobacteriota bacterium]|nr:DUF4234 domain-containing protein [bacterium]HNX18677.1 DUF4234 domain-containing protein [Acidobacteriota bacterium]